MKIPEISPFAVSTKSPRKSKNPMSIKLDIPDPELLKPKITIFGVGGAGGNALNNMIRSNLEGVEFVAANTDAQALSNSLAGNKIQLGVKTTKGLGAGSFPDRGKIAAEENVAEIEKFLDGCNMVFIAAGMGGGTGTGAAPVIAKLAREHDILTVGVVTKPFHFEGKYRMETAESGIEELKKYVDTLIVIPNQNLFRIANESTTFESAFKMADDVLHAGVRGVTDLITMPGLVNLDFADIRTIMTKMGKAMMGTGEAAGENRAILACEAAVSNPLLDDISIKGAKGVLVNMTGGPDMTLFEADMAVNAIRKEVDPSANIIFGSAFNEDMKGRIRISVVATGIDSEEIRRDAFKITEVSESNRYRVNFNSESQESANSSSDFKTDEKFSKKIKINGNFDSKEDDSDMHIEHQFDGNQNDGTEIDEKTNQDKTKKPHPLNLEEDYEIDLDNENSFFSFDKAAKFEEKEPEFHGKKSRAKPQKSEGKVKKENTGFSLFSFMNPIKSKGQSDGKISKKQIRDFVEDYEDREEDDLNKNATVSGRRESLNHDLEIDKKSRSEEKISLVSEAKKKHQEFFGETIFDEKENDRTSADLDEDVVNIPAFFRKKK